MSFDYEKYITSYNQSDLCFYFQVTASHLPEDKNGLKFFGKSGGLTKKDIDDLIVLAQAEAKEWYDMGIVPPSSGKAGVLCSELVSNCSLCITTCFLLLDLHHFIRLISCLITKIH